MIPTAETVGANQFLLAMQDDGRLHHSTCDTNIFNSEFGIGNRFEAGVDFDFDEDADTNALFNAKYIVYRNSSETSSLALGVNNVGNHLIASPYAVASQDLKLLRCHTGIIDCDGTPQWLFGIDKDVSSQFNLCADYITGADNATTIGANYQFSDVLGIFIGCMSPNPGSDSRAVRFTTLLTFGGSWLKHEK
ncbi:MAG TPA: hypothetical protein VHV83_00705 [Armatimonadota bacterium]|nr:hypothetical protein [Armatimonadota bacterium]